MRPCSFNLGVNGVVKYAKGVDPTPDWEWQIPKDWPNIREILANDVMPQQAVDKGCLYSYIVLLNSAVPAKFMNEYYGTQQEGDYIKRSDGEVFEWTGNTTSNQVNYIDPPSSATETWWCIVYSRVNKFCSFGGNGHNVLWVYAPEFYWCKGYGTLEQQTIKSFEVWGLGRPKSTNGSQSGSFSNSPFSQNGIVENLVIKTISEDAVPDRISSQFVRSSRLLKRLDLSGFRFTDGKDFGYFAGDCCLMQEIVFCEDFASGATLTNNMFANCYDLRSVPDVLDLSSCTNASYMFSNCYSLKTVPKYLNLSSCTNVIGMFSGCYSLISVPDILDLSKCTNTNSMFNNCCSLKYVPDVLDLSSSTNVQNMFWFCFSLRALPTHVTTRLGLSFQSSSLVSRDSVATFDGSGNVVGGFVGNLNTKPSEAGTQTMTFNAAIKALFTADEWTAVKSCLTAKGWAVTPA